MQYRLEIKSLKEGGLSTYIGINKSTGAKEGSGLKTPREVFRAVHRALGVQNSLYSDRSNLIGVFDVSQLGTPIQDFKVLIYIDNGSSDNLTDQLTNSIDLKEEKRKLEAGWDATFTEKKTPVWKSLLLNPLIWPMLSILMLFIASILTASAAPGVLLTSMPYLAILAPVFFMIGLLSLPLIAGYAVYRAKNPIENERHPLTAYLTERLDWIEDYPVAAGIIWGSGIVFLLISILFATAYFTDGFGFLPTGSFAFMGHVLGFIANGLIAAMHSLATLPGLEGLASIPEASLAAGCMIASAVLLAVSIFLLTEAINRFANGITDFLDPSVIIARLDAEKAQTVQEKQNSYEEQFIKKTQDIRNQLEQENSVQQNENGASMKNEQKSSIPVKNELPASNSSSTEQFNENLNLIEKDLNEHANIMKNTLQQMNQRVDAAERRKEGNTASTDNNVQQSSTIVENPSALHFGQPQNTNAATMIQTTPDVVSNGTVVENEKSLDSITITSTIIQTPDNSLITEQETDQNSSSVITNITTDGIDKPPDIVNSNVTKEPREGWSTEPESLVTFIESARQSLRQAAIQSNPQTTQETVASNAVDDSQEMPEIIITPAPVDLFSQDNLNTWASKDIWGSWDYSGNTTPSDDEKDKANPPPNPLVDQSISTSNRGEDKLKIENGSQKQSVPDENELRSNSPLNRSNDSKWTTNSSDSEDEEDKTTLVYQKKLQQKLLDEKYSHLKK